MSVAIVMADRECELFFNLLGALGSPHSLELSSPTQKLQLLLLLGVISGKLVSKKVKVSEKQTIDN